MQYTTKVQSMKFDFSAYTLDEIRAAIKNVLPIAPAGGQAHNENSRKLADLMRSQSLARDALIYLQTVGTQSIRTVTPFNLQTLVAEKFQSYAATAQNVTVEKKVFPIVAGFPDYRGKEQDIKDLLPGVTVVPFDPAYAINVAAAASMSAYTVVQGTGTVVPIIPPNAMYTGAPFATVAWSQSFFPNCGGSISASGLEWAHVMYHKFYPDKDKFMETFVACVPIRKDVLSKDETKWVKTFLPQTWTGFRPVDDIERLTALQKLQAYRSKDNAGISAMTYGIYGEQFGPQYRLTEKISNFEIFLKALDDSLKVYPIRYVAKDERELVSAFELMKRYGFTPVHYSGKPVDGIEDRKTGQYTYVDQIVYHGKCCTKPFTGKITVEGAIAYSEQNRRLAREKLVKYSGARVIGYRAHVMGLEQFVIGMSAPHNAVAVMSQKETSHTDESIWSLIMIAGHVRNTYLYHRKTLQQFLAVVDTLNLHRKVKNLPVTTYMDWDPMNRPIWHPFTKEQRKRLVAILNEYESFGIVTGDVSDQDLSNMVSVAQQDPSFELKMAHVASQAKDSGLFHIAPVGSVMLPKVMSPAQSVAGEDFGEDFSAPDPIPVVVNKPRVKMDLGIDPMLSIDEQALKMGKELSLQSLQLHDGKIPIDPGEVNQVHDSGGGIPQF